jgi:hypothetical protein
VREILPYLVRRIGHKSAYNLVHLSQRKAKLTFPLIHTIHVYTSDIADNSSQYAHLCFKHYSSSGQTSLCTNVFLGRCLSGRMSFWANVLLGKCLLGKCPSGQMSFWANVLLGKCLLGKCLSGQMSFWANVLWANALCANVHLGKCLSGHMSSGQMSSGQMSFWANVSGQMSLGNCRMGKCRVTVVLVGSGEGGEGLHSRGSDPLPPHTRSAP